ncbi:peptidase [Helicobacter sp. 11S02629-2]|nr:peptidase [Helicobacter sp. 11S02629-2]
MAKAMTNLLTTYKEQGIDKVQSILDGYLTSKEFWLNYLQGYDVNFGYYESVKYLFVANKSLPNLTLYAVRDKGLSQLDSISALVGKGKGNKIKEGDLATPIGVYDILEKLTGLNQYYGPLALTTSYPNSYDKALNKTGYGIWIHGLPLDGHRKNEKTRGCIAIDNKMLSKMDKSIDLKHSKLITYEDVFKPASKEDIATLLADLYKWKDVWEKGDYKDYIAFYSKDFVRFDKMKYHAFAEYKKRIFNKKQVKHIRISAIDISPYPNDLGKNIFLITFNQNYKAYHDGKLSFTSNGRKELYVELKDSKFGILSEK